MSNLENKMGEYLVDGLNNITKFKHTNSLAQALNFLNSSLSTITLTRESYYKEMVQYRNNYIVNGIYDILSNDILNDTSSSDVIIVSCPEDEEVQDEIEKMFKKIGVLEIIQSILPDLLHYGSYPMKPVVMKGKGVVSLVDEYYPNQVLALTDSKNTPIFYYINDSVTSNQTQVNLNNTIGLGSNFVSNGRKKRFNYRYASISDVVYFSIDLTFNKLLLPEDETQSIKSKTPDFLSKLMPRTLKVKTSQGFIYPVIDKLKEVLALDKYSVYKSIGDVLTPKLIGVPLPQTYDVDQLASITDSYNNLINDNIVKTNNLQNMEVTLQELSAVKVIPIAGDRSTPTTIDLGRNVGENDNNIQALQDSLGRLLNALGIPQELFDGSMQSKENIKTSVRYAKKVKRIAKNICRTLKFIALLHISEKFPEKRIKLEDFEIQLKNNLNLDELENLETQDLVIASLENMKSMIESFDEIVQNSNYELDKDLVIEIVKDVLSTANSPFMNVFKLKEQTSKVNAEEVINKLSEESDRD